MDKWWLAWLSKHAYNQLVWYMAPCMVRFLCTMAPDQACKLTPGHDPVVQGQILGPHLFIGSDLDPGHVTISRDLSRDLRRWFVHCSPVDMFVCCSSFTRSEYVVRLLPNMWYGHRLPITTLARPSLNFFDRFVIFYDPNSYFFE